jgi:hypothetical protein
MIQRREEQKKYLKDHYYLGKFCSNSQWITIIYEEIEDSRGGVK